MYSIAIIVAVASNDSRKREASNENQLHFTISRNFQSGDPEMVVALTLDLLVTKKGGGEREEEEEERFLYP